LEIILAGADFEVVVGVDADQILQWARTDHFDLYLLDTWVPGMSGYEMCEKLREVDSKTPILFYSAAGFQNEIDTAFGRGASDYLVKPASFDVLLAVINRLLASSSIREVVPARRSARKARSIKRRPAA